MTMETKEEDLKDFEYGDIEMSGAKTSTDRKPSKRQNVLEFAKSTHRASGAGLHESEEEAVTKKESFSFSTVGLSTGEAEQRLRNYGRNELPENKTPKWYVLVSQFWKPMSVMIWIAAVIEAGIQNFPDMGILLGILFINSFIAFYESVKAGDAVAALKRTLHPTATVNRDEKFQNIDATCLVPGDLIQLAAGSAVPADCRVNEGELDIDESSLTGESLPVTKYRGDSCKLGSTVVRGEVEATVEVTGSETFVGRTASLLANDDGDGSFHRLLLTIVWILLAIAALFCSIVFIYLCLEVTPLEALSFTVVLLVASIPLAIEIVTTTTLALGSRELASQGAIVTRLTAIEDMAGMSILCSDKTGTLTMNQMMIQDETPVFRKGENQHSLLRYAAMAAKWKEPPRDALDTLVLTSVDMTSLDKVEQLAYVPFDPIVKRTEGTVRENDTGKVYRTTKGAPHVILDLVESVTHNMRASKELRTAVEHEMHDLGARGIRALAVAKTNNRDVWEFLGLLTFLDPPRPDTKQTLADAARYGVAVKMVTGDHVLIAKEMARVLGMGDFIKNAQDLPSLELKTKKKPENLARDYGDMCLSVDAFAQVFPEHKYLIVECLRELGYKVGMTGDGVNDAPALKRADVGIAVAGATDAARAAADIVLTEPGLSTIMEGILIARRIFMRIQSFLTYRFAATLQLLCFFFIAMFAFKPSDYMPVDWETRADFPDQKEWPFFYSLPVLMLMLITLLNDGTIIAVGYDNAQARMQPEKWNLPVLFLVSLVMGLINAFATLILLCLSLSSWQEGGLYQRWGLGGLSYGQITTSIYMQLSVSQFLTLFSARTGANWFWSSAPSVVLLSAGAVALLVSTVLAITWPDSTLDGIPTQGLALRSPYLLPLYIWLYCLVFWVAQDACKVLAFAILIRYDILGINDTGRLELPASARKYIAEHKEEDARAILGE